MKYKNVFLFFVLIFLAFTVRSQSTSATINDLFKDRGEVFFKFTPQQVSQIAKLSSVISIDDIKGVEVYAYANEKEFSNFLDWGLDYELLTAPGLQHAVVMKDWDQIKAVNDWDFYPTYEAYVAMMNQFQTDYPELCEIINIGETAQGRDLLVARISDNIGVDEGEPGFLYTATMHGDETAGYVLTLRLIDYLLSNYGSDPEVDNLVNNLDIWINPLANPDGTYHGGNSSVFGAQRYNGNNIDLNRNYPDPLHGPHPDGNAWQPETVAFMNLADQHHFVLSSNFHAGAEVCNYPWDTWPQLHADDDWWQMVCHEYADTAHANSPTGYMSGYDNGITNGYAWYSISGGRQDYMNYFQHCREFTLELSNIKLLPESQLPAHWNYNYQSFLNYMKQTLYGINGTVSDASSGLPVHAMVSIDGHDIDSSMVFSDAGNGKYFRPIFTGNYDLTFSADGYYPQTIENVSASNYETTTLDVQLLSGDLIADFSASSTSVSIGSSIDFTDLTFGNVVSWDWTFEGAEPATSNMQNPTGILYPEAGSYDVSLTVSDGVNSQTITKEDYIQVSLDFTMQNTTVTTCEGLFMDTGGENGNYSNNEDLTMIFLPEQSGAMLSCDFLSFDVEAEANCDYDYLKIYDGNSMAAPLLGTWCGTNSPGYIEASNEAGALVFVFHSDASVTGSGWTANIACVGSVLVPIADFSASSTTIIEGDSIQFTDLSQNAPTSWSWSFPGGNPGTSSEQNPLVSYDTPGIYSVGLVAANGAGSNSMFKPEYITVEQAVGINTQAKIPLYIFPNPAQDKVFIQSNQKITNISLINLMGEKLLEMNAENGIQQFDVSAFPEGSYILIMNTKTDQYHQKIQLIK